MSDGGLIERDYDGSPDSSSGGTSTEKSPVDLLYSWLEAFTDEVLVDREKLEMTLLISSDIFLITSLSSDGYEKIKNMSTIGLKPVGVSDGDAIVIVYTKSEDSIYERSVNYGIKEVATGLLIRFHEKHIDEAKDVFDPEFIVRLDDSRVLAAVTDSELYDPNTGILYSGSNQFSLTTISHWENEIGDSILMTQDLKRVVDLKFRSDVLSDSMIDPDGKSRSSKVSLPLLVVTVSTATLFALLVVSGGLSIDFRYHEHIGIIALIALNVAIFYQDLNESVAQ
ncbi:hypothetical protein [Natrinema versiforme]|uniref:Uncharacterized protein n=1 Tax=Natrinema versiforme TaxID=88724 RepID=A0A4P8WHL4_9EURY|nr:hypothetical protein [Natrinema versiforme]QCS42654.1 hypothetical protein FEJ81_09895 [Natrinema versiforme]